MLICQQCGKSQGNENRAIDRHVCDECNDYIKGIKLTRQVTQYIEKRLLKNKYYKISKIVIAQ